MRVVIVVKYDFELSSQVYFQMMHYLNERFYQILVHTDCLGVVPLSIVRPPPHLMSKLMKKKLIKRTILVN